MNDEYRLACTVHFSTGQPAQVGQPILNSFGLRGVGRLLIGEHYLIFEGEQSGVSLLRPKARMARADLANCEYNPETLGILIRTEKGGAFVALWAASVADAEAIWRQLPQHKTPEFLAEQAHHQRFEGAMAELGSRAPVTPTIIALNIIMFGIVLAAGADFVKPSGEVLIRFGSNFGPRTWSGEPWRLLSAAFLHAGILHIAFNMYALYQGGSLVERLFGSARFTLIYLLSALAGSVASGWWDPMRNSVGASGAIFGVFGALLVFVALRRQDLPPQLWRSIGGSTLGFCGYSLAMGAVHPAIDNAAHVGGLLGGMVSGLVLLRAFDAQARTRPQPMRLVAAALLVLLPLALLARPLLTQQGDFGLALRFEQALTNFARVEVGLNAKQADLLRIEDGNLARPDVAARLRSEVLAPWRAAAQTLRDLPRLPKPDSRRARLQAAVGKYIEARELALNMIVDALRDGDGRAMQAAAFASQHAASMLDQVNRISAEGT